MSYKGGKWNRPEQDAHRQRNPRVTAEDRKAAERAAENYAKAQGAWVRVLEVGR